MSDDIVMDGIREFLGKQFPTVKNIDNDEPLLKRGIIDSLGILEVVSFVESEFGIVVLDEDLMPENFGSVRCIAEFVRSKANVVIGEPAPSPSSSDR